MMQLWKEKHLECDVTEQRFMDQKRYIIRVLDFTDMGLQHFSKLSKYFLTQSGVNLQNSLPWDA